MVGQAEPVSGSDMCLLDMHQLPSLLPELVDQPGLVHAGHNGELLELVGQAEPVPGSDMCLLDMHQLPSLLPELVDQPGLVHAGHNGELLELVEPLQA
ncbi:hypothetical protein HaLaN_10809 [Haematococcus lacustris]|uniref:Uncharacterized protein n=1 Tax=Haematococcus lacustris TaxID=44745 RepID=A0A699ZGH2_HAELA|nr:hypothetical protein HaLaN_10809 [Haematococcus lacustris]